MPRPSPAVHPALALAGWCPLSPAGAQTTQLLVEPPWTPPVRWDRVTLTCQGSGTLGATTWYKDGQRWWLQGPDRFRVNESGTYQCDRPGTGRSPSVSVLNDWLVLQVPARALLEGDTVTLRCRSWQDNPVTSVSFYREEKQLQQFRERTELSLSPLRLQDSGRYRCRGWVETEVWRWKESAPVTVTVHVAAGVAGSLLFLVLLVGVIVGCHWWHRLASRKHQERAPQEPPAPPEEGEVLYTHVTMTKRTQGPTRTAPPQDTQVTYAELPGPHGRPRAPSDIYGNVLGH
ncbi:LOW QUALITY PROTEIN: low affinity immunoglobulin gamma Fc region receptor III-like [Cyanocitta cristata]